MFSKSGRRICIAVSLGLILVFALPLLSRGKKPVKPAPPSRAVAPRQCGDCLVHVVAKGEGLGLIARHYIDRTSYLTLPDLESAISQTNGWKQKVYFQPGEKVLIPGILNSPIIEHPIPVPKNFEARGIYMTEWVAGSDHGLDLIRRWRAAGGNAVAFDLKDMDGVPGMPFNNPLAKGAHSAPIRSLPKFVHILHSQGMHAIARIALFRDAYLAQHEPQLDPRSRKTGKPWRENGKQVWVDPSLREVQDYNLALARQAAGSGVDEIQFDYVRFPAEGDQADATFAFETALPKWNRSDVITAFLKRAYGELRPMGVLVSLDVFGVMAWQKQADLAHTGQDIPQMVRYCDVLSPMIYPSHFFGFDNYTVPGDAPEHFISESMERFRRITAGSHVVLRPWLQAFGWRTPDYSPAYIIEQVKVARQEGGIGFLFWNARNNYADVFPAMAKMRAAAGEYFRGDELRASLSRPSASKDKTRNPGSKDLGLH